MSSDGHHLVFVYGTLKKEQPNHYLIRDPRNGKAKFIAKAVTAERFPLVVGTKYNIPFLLDKRGEGHKVTGAVYRVDDSMLKVLDKLECHPDLYTRIDIEVVVTELGCSDTELPYSVDDTIKSQAYLILNPSEELCFNQHFTAYSVYHPDVKPYISADGRSETDYSQYLLKSVHQIDT